MHEGTYNKFTFTHHYISLDFSTMNFSGSHRKSRVKKIILGLISTAILVAVLVALFLPNILPKETQNETAALKVSDLDLKLVHVVSFTL